MALIEKLWNDLVARPRSLRLDPVEVAQMGKSSTTWFHEVPTSAYEDELSQRNKVCRGCVLYSGSEGNFEDRDLSQIIVRDRQCTGIYLEVYEAIPLAKTWWLEAGAPRGTFSKPDPRALCTK